MTDAVLGYRLVKKKWREVAFNGGGARLYGGRWNSRGMPCIYLAGSESLATLEVMVHLQDYSLLQHYSVLEVKLQESDIKRLSEQDFPDDWTREPAPSSTAEVGDRWLTSRDTLALAVPSVVIPRELNYLLNPGHPGFPDLVASATEIGFRPDGRLFEHR